MKEEIPPFFVDQAVRFSDVDMYRVVWHGRYVAWLEEARNGLASLAGFSLVGALDRGYRFPIVELSLGYKRPAQLGDTVRVFPRYQPEPIARISFAYEIRKIDGGQLLASAVTRQMILRGDELLVTMPPDVREILSKLERVQSAWPA